ncbi:MAG TPA: methyltransferase domain-containing protein [Candidatus Acidoferrales bacterium]|nr:methyltransferase domain-containing protein [Candidatus Acidoferrales bacterium]
MEQSKAAPALTDRELEKAYAHRFAGEEKQRQRVWNALVAHFFQKWVRADDTVVDLGAGYCEFINAVRAERRYAIDLNPELRSRVGSGVTPVVQDITQRWNLPDGSANVVFTSNFLEHLPTKSDLTHCLEESRRILQPGGRFIALGPNIRFAYKVYWDYFDHFLPLSDRSLVEALELHGFTVERAIPRFLPFTMKGKRPPSSLAIRMYLALPIFWPLFGRQFLIVAKT